MMNFNMAEKDTFDTFFIRTVSTYLFHCDDTPCVKQNSYVKIKCVMTE